NLFSDTERPAEHDGHVGVGYIDPFVQDACGYEAPQSALPKMCEHGLPLRASNLRSNCRNEIVTRNRPSVAAMCRDHERLVRSVPLDQAGCQTPLLRWKHRESDGALPGTNRALPCGCARHGAERRPPIDHRMGS